MMDDAVLEGQHASMNPHTLTVEANENVKKSYESQMPLRENVGAFYIRKICKKTDAYLYAPSLC